ncbi:MAG: Jag N-terminal domain-containing protein, partial [Spirochaetaceae bacterium]|nr:Jag N-terminal domain-containing protein [Spirochaetaceae bacterium]
MVDFVQLQQIVKERLEQDRAIRSVAVSGPTLEAAVAEAATLLDLPVRRLEYEITARGSPGFLGSGKKEWNIQAYERILTKRENEGTGRVDEEAESTVPVVEDKNGEVFVHLGSDGVLLKVTAPTGKGKRISEGEARQKLLSRYVKEIDEDIFARVVEE